jgi:REP element-mobilizing transposase RayT
VHLLLTPRRDELGTTFGTAEIMHAIKGVSARRVNRMLSRSGHVWQDESFDHVLRNDEDRRATAEYICANPVRAGLVQADSEYRWLWREWIEGAGITPCREDGQAGSPVPH